ETCIKGHRSSGCKHTDRPLYIIKPKGRPQSQCEHCRELRKTKQVHVKCTCQQKGEATAGGGQTTSDSGRKGILQGAAFPNGLPEDLEATVSRQLSSEGVSFDSEY
ncbi:transcription factor, partial [Gymnopus androsaceus JB14]